MLRVFSSMCSNSKGWQKTTPAHLHPRKRPARHPHENELKGAYFAPMTSIPVMWLQSPGNLVEIASLLQEAMGWYGSGRPRLDIPSLPTEVIPGSSKASTWLPQSTPLPGRLKDCAWPLAGLAQLST